MAPKKNAAKGKAKGSAAKLKAKAKPAAKDKRKAAAGASKQGKKAGNAAKGKGKGAAKGKPGKKVGGLKGMFKSAGDKMKEKVMSKGALLEKKMKEGTKHMQEKMKAKGQELRKRMKDKMEEASHDLKHKGKGLRKKLKAKGKHLQEKVKHKAEEMEGRGMAAASDVRGKLQAWRKKFEDMGWAQGEMLDDWATMMLIGLNAFGIAMAIPVFGITAWLAGSFKKVCLTHLLSPAVSIGFVFSLALLLNALAGFFGAWFNRLPLVKFHFFFTLILIIMLFNFTLFGLLVTSKGKGAPVEGAKFRVYSLSDYSRWLKDKILQWEKIKECIEKQKFCDKLSYTTAAEFYSAKMTRIQSGCCIPPRICGYVFERERWRYPTNKTADVDCSLWKWKELCVNCNACKAAFLQEVKSRWKMASVINMVIVGGLIVVLYRTWYVMRAAGCWDTIFTVIKNSFVGLGSSIKNCFSRKKAEDNDDDSLAPSWLEGTESEDEEKKKDKKSGGLSSLWGGKKKKSSSKEAKEEQEEPQEQALVDEFGQQLGEETDDAWASPQQQVDPSLGYFPEGYFAQNPLAQQPMSPPYYGYQDPYAQQPYAQPQQDLYAQQDPYAQTYYQQAAYAYNQADPYGQQLYQDTYQNQQQGYMLDPNQAGGYVDPSQGYMDPSIQHPGFVQNYPGYTDMNLQQMDPNQGYVDPNQNFQVGFGSNQDRYQQGYYMQDPGFMVDLNQNLHQGAYY